MACYFRLVTDLQEVIPLLRSPPLFLIRVTGSSIYPLKMAMVTAMATLVLKFMLEPLEVLKLLS